MIKKIMGAVFIAAPLILVIFVLRFREMILQTAEHFPRCIFYEITGYFCPACGNTRSVCALLRGDVIESLTYNITPMVLIIILALYYVEFFSKYVFSYKLHLLPRNLAFWMTLIGVVTLYYVVRNFTPLHQVLSAGIS